ncbi:MAG: hypothetical protein WA160_03290 [Pseudobdellovibrio sp.]
MLFKKQLVNFVFAFYLLIATQSCQTLDNNSSQHGLKIVSPTFEKKLNNLQSFDSIVFNLDSSDVHISNITPQNPTTLTNVITKKITQFVSFFEDDIDPYTRQPILRKKCLSSVSNNQVAFFSGPKNLWTDCRLNTPQLNPKALTTRQWIACDKTIWEITAKANLLIISCF